MGHFHQSQGRLFSCPDQGSSQEVPALHSQGDGLPVGLTTVPKEFTKVTATLASIVHRKGINLPLYLDDWLLRANSFQKCLTQTKEVLADTTQLSFIVNPDKSELIPTQQFSFLGEDFDLALGIVRPSEEKVDKILTLCRILRKHPCQEARFLLKVLGVLNTVADVIPELAVFLVTLASGRRRSEIHALSVDPECFRFSPNLSQVSHLTEPGFLSKTQKASKMPAKIVIQSIAKHVGHDLPDYALCTVRALKAYKDKTKSDAVRKNRKRLFIPYRDSQDDIRPYHISKWIVELVKRAHRDANDDAYRLANVTAHEVRAIATSWAAYNNAPFEEIMQASDWSGNTKFTSFFSRAMATR